MINVSLSCDKNFIAPYAVTLASILFYHPNDINFYLIHDRMDPADYAPLEEVIARMGHNCRLIPVEVGQYTWEGWPTHHAWPRAVYYRLNIAEILPDVDKVIDTDGDLLVVDDIQKVWDIPMDNYPIAAVYINPTSEETEKHCFNNGFICLNLKYMRKNNYAEKIQQAAESIRDNMNLVDQDIQNVAFKGHILHLPYRWNVTTSMCMRTENYVSIPEDENIEALRHPAVIHFNVCKPWKTAARIKTPYIFLYPPFLKMTRPPLKFKLRIWWKCVLRLFQRYRYTPWQKEHLNAFYEAMADIRKTLRRK